MQSAPTVAPPGMLALPAGLPSRRERVAALRALVGRPDPAVRHLALGIRDTARRHFERHVSPLVTRHWPALVGQPFHAKLRIGACDLYASAPYTALFCAPRRPLVIRAVTDTANLLPLPAPAMALLGRGAMEIIGRLALPREHRRIALIAAFIVVVDHVFDHCLTEPAEERGRRLAAIIDGREAPTTPELALTRALAAAMGEGLEGRERADFEHAMAELKGWIRAEVAALRGDPDPRGLGHRMAGVEGTIDGLLFPVARYAGPSARAWMIDVSFFVQVADDWLDAEDDARSGRPTPVLAGAWTMDDVASTWARTLSGVEALVRDAGLRSPRYARFVRDAYALMMAEVLEAMASRPGQ
jgi:hypothetical protein